MDRARLSRSITKRPFLIRNTMHPLSDFVLLTSIKKRHYEFPIAKSVGFKKLDPTLGSVDAPAPDLAPD